MLADTVQGAVGTQQQLARLLLKNVLYCDVTQWNRVVRVCEALSIVGWGELKRLRFA